MTFLVAAFIAVWLLVLIYVIYMIQRQRSLEQELRSLEESIAEQGRAKSK